MAIKLASKIDIYVYSVVFLIFYTSGFIYNNVYYNHNYLFKSMMMIMIIPCVLLLSREGFANLVKTSAIILGIIVLSLINNGDIDIVIKMLFRLEIVYLFFLYCVENGIDILDYVYKAILMIAVLYLIAWLLFDVGPLAYLARTIHINNIYSNGWERNYSYTDYLHVYYRWQGYRSVLGLKIIACNGPFWEPGAYQIYLNLALWISMFTPKGNWKHRVLLTVAIITTTSTIGVIVLCGLWIVYILESLKGKDRLVAMLPMIMVFFVIVYQIWEEKKIYGVASINNRTEDLYFLISRIRMHPFIGNGMGNQTGDNGILLLIADFGVVGLFYVFYLIKRVIKSNREISARVAMLAWFLLSNMNEVIVYHSLFFLIILTLGYRQVEVECIDNN